MLNQEAEPRGWRAESYLAEILARRLLLDFVHLKPELNHPASLREHCDLLIENGRDALVLQIKMRGDETSKDIANKSWAAKHAKIAQRQVIGAIKNLGRKILSVEHPYRGNVVFSPGDLDASHGLVIVEYNGEPFAISKELPNRTENQIPIHYITYGDFLTICDQLGTLPDLMQYLDARANIPLWSRPMLGDELNVLAFFLTHKRKIPHSITASDFEKQWQFLTVENSRMYEEKKRADLEALPYTRMVELIRGMDFELSKDLVDRPSPCRREFEDNRIEILRILNNVPLVVRRRISNKMFEALKRAQSSKNGMGFFSVKNPLNDNGYTFLASKETVKKRLERLEVLAFCTAVNTGAKKVVGIATEALETDLRSFQAGLWDYTTEVFEEEDYQVCSKLFNDAYLDRNYDFPSNNPLKPN